MALEEGSLSGRHQSETVLTNSPGGSQTSACQSKREAESGGQLPSLLSHLHPRPRVPGVPAHSPTGEIRSGAQTTGMKGSQGLMLKPRHRGMPSPPGQRLGLLGPRMEFLCLDGP